jgi:hypothetical protein
MQPRFKSVMNGQGVKHTRLQGKVALEFSTYIVFPPYTYMKALILAAGDGGRLENLTQDKPKPLIQLLGLSLIERIIFDYKTSREFQVQSFSLMTTTRKSKQSKQQRR